MPYAKAAKKTADDEFIWQILVVPYAQTRKKPTIACPKLARLLSCPREFPFQQRFVSLKPNPPQTSRAKPALTGRGQRTKG